MREAYSPYVERIGRELAPMGANYDALIARGVVHVLPEPTGSGVRGVIVLIPLAGAMLVENVAVHPRYQRRGLGRRLMSFAEDQARAAGLREMSLYTNKAMTENVALYKHLGYVEVARKEEAGFRRVYMRKALQ